MGGQCIKERESCVSGSPQTHVLKTFLLCVLNYEYNIELDGLALPSSSCSGGLLFETVLVSEFHRYGDLNLLVQIVDVVIVIGAR